MAVSYRSKRKTEMPAEHCMAQAPSPPAYGYRPHHAINPGGPGSREIGREVRDRGPAAEGGELSHEVRDAGDVGG